MNNTVIYFKKEAAATGLEPEPAAAGWAAGPLASEAARGRRLQRRGGEGRGREGALTLFRASSLHDVFSSVSVLWGQKPEVMPSRSLHKSQGRGRTGQSRLNTGLALVRPRGTQAEPRGQVGCSQQLRPGSKGPAQAAPVAPAHDYRLGGCCDWEALAPVPPLVLTGGPSPTSQLIVSRQTDRQGQTGGVTNTATGWLAQPALARGLVPPGRAVPGGSFTLIFHLILRAGTVDRTFHIRKGIFTSKESSHPQASCKEARRNCTCLLPSDGVRPPGGPRSPEAQEQGHWASPSVGPCREGRGGGGGRQGGGPALFLCSVFGTRLCTQRVLNPQAATAG